MSLLCVVLVAVTAHPGASLNRWLTNPVFTWIGKRSYGIYLYQFPVMIFYEAKVTDIADHVLLHTLVEITLILIISELSYRYVERPLARFAEETRNNSENTTSSVDQAILDKYELSKAQGNKAQKLELTAFGDSVMLDAATDLQELYPKVVVDGDVGRQLYASVPYIEKLKEQDLLKDTVLIGLGTNGSFSEAQFDSVMDAIGDRKVYWVNVRVPTKRWQNDVNAMLEQMTKKYDNMTLIDWYSYSNDHSDWFYDDQVHPNPEGMTHYIHLVSEALLGGSSSTNSSETNVTE